MLAIQTTQGSINHLIQVVDTEHACIFDKNPEIILSLHGRFKI